MDQATHDKIVSFICGIADDVLRDLFRRGKYPDVIRSICVLRRMDAVLEPTKKVVLETKQILDKAGPRHFYEARLQRMFDEISPDILAVKKKGGGLLDGGTK